MLIQQWFPDTQHSLRKDRIWQVRPSPTPCHACSCLYCNSCGVALLVGDSLACHTLTFHLRNFCHRWYFVLDASYLLLLWSTPQNDYTSSSKKHSKQNAWLTIVPYSARFSSHSKRCGSWRKCCQIWATVVKLKSTVYLTARLTIVLVVWCPWSNWWYSMFPLVLCSHVLVHSVSNCTSLTF